MPRLSATPGVLGAAIPAAVALWWLPGAWLQAAGGFADLPGLSARAAFYVVLAQAVLVPLFAARWFGNDHGNVGARIAGDATLRAVASRAMRAPTLRDRLRVGGIEVVAAIVPAWPLLVLLWLTSELSAHALVASQLAIVFVSVLLAWSGGALTRSSCGDGTTEVIRGVAGLVPAVVAWSFRGDLHAWVLS